MKEFELTFLGTGTSQGVPVIGGKDPANFSCDKKDKRLRTSALLSLEGGKNILIDCGPDFRYQMLREGIDDLSAIIFTHHHSDHAAGLDDIRPICYFKNKSIPIYGTQATVDDLKTRFRYIFASEDERYPGAPEVREHVIENGREFEIEGIKILPFFVMHGRLPITGYRIGSFAYMTDVSFIPEESFVKLIGVKTLVINALRVKDGHPMHFILPESLSVCAELKTERAYLTHISAAMGFHKDVEQILPKGVHLAYDGLKIKVEY